MTICCDKKNLPFSRLAKNEIKIYLPRITHTDITQATETDSLIATVKAVIRPLSGTEPFQFAQLESKVKAIITIRYISDLADTAEGGKYYIKFGNNRRYNIIAVKNLDTFNSSTRATANLEGKRFQNLICTENEAV